MNNISRSIVAAALAFPLSLLAQTIVCTATASSGNEYVPSKGSTTILEDSYGRYIYQWMYWHEPSRLTFLKRLGATFEPDAFFYNYDGTAYGLVPTGYWASDLPAAYVDTQFDDPPEEKAITIGSGDTVSLVDGRWYYTVTRMTSGPSASSWVKLSAQRGAQQPTGCTSTWCSFGCSDTNNFKTIPFTDHFSAPGCQIYYWNYYITTREAC